MKNIIDRAANYASEKTNEMLSQLVAQAFSDGYREGYKDCRRTRIFPWQVHTDLA